VREIRSRRTEVPDETGKPNDETPISFIGTANVDVTALSQKDASDYRQELRRALHNPGIEWDVLGEAGLADRKFYHAKLKEVDEYLQTFEEKI
jgi:hypothetical protein